MNSPECFQKLGASLHQDVDLSADGNIAAYCLGLLTAQERADLEPFLQDLLATSTGGELKGAFNRTLSDRWLSGKDTRLFLEAVMEELTNRRP